MFDQTAHNLVFYKSHWDTLEICVGGGCIIRVIVENFKRETYDFLRENPEYLTIYEPIIQDALNKMTPEERLRGLASDDVLKHYNPEERVRDLDPNWLKEWLKRNGY